MVSPKSLKRALATEIARRLKQPQCVELRAVAMILLVNNCYNHKEIAALLPEMVLFSASPVDDRMAIWINYGDEYALLAHPENLKELGLFADLAYDIAGLEVICLLGADGGWIVERQARIGTASGRYVLRRLEGGHPECP
jgi:hypothetical protein